MSVHEAATSGDRLATLRKLRDTLARSVDECDSMRDLAALSGRLQSVLDEIAKIEGPRKVGDNIDEIAQRRSARRASSAKRPVRAKREN